MLLARSHLNSNLTIGHLGTQSHLRPKKNTTPRPYLFTLTLTSLIDAFAILVIYLLMQNPSGEQDIALRKTEELPSSVAFQPIDNGFAVRITNNKFFIDDQEVPTSKLVRRLYDIRQQLIKEKIKDSSSLIIQADRRSTFQNISPLVQAGAQTGFSKIKFAVLPRKDLAK